MPVLPLEQAQRIAALQKGYQVRFETRMSASTSLSNYEYLDILDRAWSASGARAPDARVVCDVGSASFWYAATLNAFFRPQRLIGIEVEGHRLFRDGRTRIDYAAGYTEREGNAEFVVADYLSYDEPADVITAWFPFLTPNAILAWRLPLSLLRPQRLFRRIHHNLKPGGLFLMVNHGPQEAGLAADWCTAENLELMWRDVPAQVLGAPRMAPPVVSCWTRGNSQ